MKHLALIFISLVLLSSCGGNKESADFILYNGKIYTVDSSFSIHEAMAVKNGKILELGTFGELQQKYVTQERINLENKSVYPGLIDAHCHFLYYGLFLQRADLTGTKSFQEVITRLKNYQAKNPDKQWILGRGWDQNDWSEKQFPTVAELDKDFPDIPVYIERIDGHAAIINSKAAAIAGLSPRSTIQGGLVEVKNGKITGILVDNAMELVRRVLPVPPIEEKIIALKEAERKCFGVGLTTVDDAGLDKSDIMLIDSLQKAGILKIRVYAMISDKKANLDYYLVKGPYKTDRLNVRSVKYYVDGALGSRGALLKKPYTDRSRETGLLLNTPEHFMQAAELLKEKGFQMNSHCIGDSANKLMLDIYGAVLKGKNDLRWRIEHSQVIEDTDLKKFGDYSVIPSVQPVHATSDMYWTKERLGDRERTGYRYKDLLESSGIIATGSDFPVEDINPFYGFYAAVTRKDRKGFPENGFNPENKISREAALKGMTLWAAFSNFEEKEKGSLEPGKLADFVVLDKDLMEIKEDELYRPKVILTYINGKKVYQSPH